METYSRAALEAPETSIDTLRQEHPDVEEYLGDCQLSINDTYRVFMTGESFDLQLVVDGDLREFGRGVWSQSDRGAARVIQPGGDYAIFFKGIDPVLTTYKMALADGGQQIDVNDVLGSVERVDFIGVGRRFLTLVERTSLSPREAEVVAWEETGVSHRAIAGVMGVDQGAVVSYTDRAVRKVERAAELVDLLGDRISSE